MKYLFLIIICFLASLKITAQEFTAKEFITLKKDTLNYQELLPENYDIKQKYPLVLFLHGAGERGSDNRTQLTHGSKMFTNPVNREKYPAIVLFPQCPNDRYWPFEKRPMTGFDLNTFPAEYNITRILQAVKELLDQYITGGNVDTNRIYIIGLSMGGMGAFDLVCRFPDTFAAAIPICGGVNPDRLKAPTGKVKFRIFHGDKDDIVPVENSRKAYLALKKYGANVEYTEFVGCNHGSWDPAFNTPDFFSWLFKQSKK